MKKNKSIFPMLLFAVIFCCSCSYKQAEDGLKTKISSNTQDNISSNTAGGTFQNQLSLNEGENIFLPGDTILYTDPFTGGQMEYTVNEVILTDDLKSVGIKREDLMMHSDYQNYDIIDTLTDEKLGYIDEDGKILSLYSDTQYKMLVLTITVKNISYDYKGAGMQNLWMEDAVASKEELLNPAGTEFQYSIYFSLHPSFELSGVDYNHYQLEIGEEKEIRLGFLGQEEYFRQPLYYVIGYHYQFQDNTKFIKIEAEKE